MKRSGGGRPRSARRPAAVPAGEPCPTCGRPLGVCVCDKTPRLETAHDVLILQHPREQDVALGSARLVAAAVPRAVLRVGLSWRSLAQALEVSEADPAAWAVVFPQKTEAELRASHGGGSRYVLLDARGRPRSVRGIAGVVLLDGSWSQAKTLWWRNPWLLKLNRLVLEPLEPSIYGRVRPEPKKEYVSTLEAAAEALDVLGEPESVRQELRKVFRTMVQRARDGAGR